MREDLRQEWSAHGLQGLSEAVKQQEVLNTESHKIAKEASDELARLKRVMREYNPDS